MTTSRGLTLCLLLILSSCTKSPLDKCMDDQMAAWSSDNERHQKWVERYQRYFDEHPEEKKKTVIIGGVDTPVSALGSDPDGDPPSEEVAKAAANLKCGRVYGNR